MTITVDVDEGVTPAFIGCPHCKKAMASSFMYQIPGCMYFGEFKNGQMTILPADYEWYKPNEKETLMLRKDEAEHVFKGGLLMRKRTTAKAIMKQFNQK
ncbi:MAG: hypothetical protein GX567_00930 [Clostridia bacterium]|nr:hypothetical protein [Clostridia bacterium]